MIGAAQQLESAMFASQSTDAWSRTSSGAARREYSQVSPFHALRGGSKQTPIVVALKPTVDLAANSAGTMLARSSSRQVVRALLRQPPAAPVAAGHRWTASHEADLRLARAEALQSILGDPLSEDDAADQATAKIGATTQEQPAPYLSLIWSLVEGQQLRKARALLSVVPNSSEYVRLKKLLSTPAASTSLRKDVDRSAEYAWLAQHAKDYVGRWVAVSGDSLVAVGDTLKEVRQRIRELAPARKPLVHYVE